MLIFLSKSGKVYAKSSPTVFSHFDETLTREQNERIFYRNEAEALKPYGFKQTTWAQELCEFTGSIKELYDFVTTTPILYKSDDIVNATRNVFQLLLAHKDDLFKSEFEDMRLGKLAMLHRFAGEEEKAKELFAKQYELFNAESEKLLEYRRNRVRKIESDEFAIDYAIKYKIKTVGRARLIMNLEQYHG